MATEKVENVSRVNARARRKRHKRLMNENPSILRKKILKRLSRAARVFAPDSLKTLFKSQSKHVKFLKDHFSHNHTDCADLPCQKKFTKKVAYTVLLFFLLSSVDLYHLDLGSAYAKSNDGIFSELSLVADDEGYLSKSMPTGNRNYANREGLITHKVESGETVSGIAYMYGLRTATILDNNPELGAGNFLKAGKDLVILPTDGYLYTVKKGDNLGKIAKAFKMEEDTISQHNEDAVKTLNAGEKIILAGVRSPQAARYIASSRNNSFRSGAIIGGQSVPSAPNVVGFQTPTPVNARYSRGFTSWHVGLDISRKDKSWSPNVVSPISGTVTKVRQTGWNGGYGSHIRIKRDDGIEVIMAHFAENRIYVREGEQVVGGQIVGLMGTTGRSSGVHLHIEVIQDGIKRNPLNYFSI